MKRRENRAALDVKVQRLDLINLSNMNINEHQIAVSRKGPTFCPTPKDVNWQLVHDDLEALEARLCTAYLKSTQRSPSSTKGTR